MTKLIKREIYWAHLAQRRVGYQVMYERVRREVEWVVEQVAVCLLLQDQLGD